MPISLKRPTGFFISLSAMALCLICGTRPVGATTPEVDALWAQAPDNSNLSVCQDPTSTASGGCFGPTSLIPIDKTNGIYQPATDGTNVYLGSQPGYSCPASDYGQNCTKTQVGWGGFIPTTIAAADGNIWIGSGTGGAASGLIYKCPSDLPYTNASSDPADCVELDDAGNRNINALV